MLGYYRKPVCVQTRTGRFLRTGIILTAFSLVIATLSASPLYATIISVPGDFPTIQEAVNAAVPGDVINIGHHAPFKECVTISTKEITLNGGKIIPFDCVGPAIKINQGVTGVQIIRLNIRFSRDEGILGEGGNDGTVIKNCSVVSNFKVGVKLEGNNMEVESCRVLGNRLGGIEVEGSNNTISQSRCIGSDAFGVKVTGNNNQIEKSSSLRNNKAGMLLSGDNNAVENNVVMANAEDGIVFTESSSNRVEGNVVRSNRGVAIKFPADSNFNDIIKNKLSSGPDYGILIISGEYNTIDSNKVKSFGNDGIRIIGSNKSIKNNTVQSIYNGKGISVEGDKNTITGNEVSDCSDTGILYAGNRSTLDSNKIRSCIIDADANAIGVGGDENVISNNECSEISSYVIDVRGNSNTISGNTVGKISGNPIFDSPGSFSASGFLVVGNKNELVNNTSQGNNMDGIRVNGNKNLVSRNVSTFNGHFGEHGIDVDGNKNTIDGNECRSNIGDGINVYGDFNKILNNAVTENGVDGIDVDGDNGDRTEADITHGGNEIVGNFAQLNAAEGIENNALSGAGCVSGGGTLIKNNTSQFNGLCDFAVSRRNPGDPLCDAVAPGSIPNSSLDGSHTFECAPQVDSF